MTKIIKYFFLKDSRINSNLVLHLKNINTKKIEKQNLFYCKQSKAFVNIMFVCDKHVDCILSEDEKNCSYKFDEFFQCNKSKILISYKLVCNHINDCEDNSDEMQCS